MKKWTLKMYDQTTTFTVVEPALAVLPQSHLRHLLPFTTLLSSLGKLIPADAFWNYPGANAITGMQEKFTQAGWAFIEPSSAIAAAAEAYLLPSFLQGELDALRHILIDEAGILRLTTNMVTVQLLDPTLPANAARQKIQDDGLEIVRQLSFGDNLFQTRIPQGRSLFEVVHELQTTKPHYRFTEPDLLEVITGRMAPPTDARFGEQWQHQRIQSLKAWNTNLGGGVRIAVIDNGMQIDHPDLREGIVRAASFRSADHSDATFVRHQAGMSFPDKNHGTICLGLAGARINNNGLGVCGSAPEADLIAIACLPDQVGTQATLARAIKYAANPQVEDAAASSTDGADIISCNLGPPSSGNWPITSVLQNAIEFAAGQRRRGTGALGIPIFWAVANKEVSLSSDQVCSHQDVIAVGNSTRSDRSDKSAFGPKLEFLAPGKLVVSTFSQSGFGAADGASCAAPLAAGVAALLLAKHPEFTSAQVRERLRRSCDKVPNIPFDTNGHNPKFGFGIINASKVVED